MSADGAFEAKLFHGFNAYGTYSEREQSGITIISFTYDGITVDGEIRGNVMTVPHEWDDGHGHDTELTLR